MKNRALLVCAALALASPLLVQAGQTYADRAAAKAKNPALGECDAQTCSVSVTATACNGTSIYASPDTVAVIKTHKGVMIVWTVGTAGYTFDKKNGIVFKDAAQGQFKCKARAKATEYECANKNGDALPTAYSYGITLHDSSNATCTLDPTIINGY